MSRTCRRHNVKDIASFGDCPECLKEMASTPAPGSALDIGRLLKAVPRDVLKKISLHDLHRIAQNYNANDTNE